jgi:phenylalanyl-tRNA synthetase alpha chain
MDLEQIVIAAQHAFAQAVDSAALEDQKARFLGKSSQLNTLLQSLRTLDVDRRKVEGPRINAARQYIEKMLHARRAHFAEAQLQARLAAAAIDVTLPGRKQAEGRLHPVMESWARIEHLFRTIGFDIVDGPEIETDWYNFTALNNPADHPARSMQDTFYINAPQVAGPQGGPLLLRTHTSAMQIRYVQTRRPPIRVIAAGRTYRVDSDATHAPMFHQIEGLWIDEQVNFAHLKSVYIDFLHRFFERDDLRVRFRPSYFPFTEPSAEIDVMFEEGEQTGQWLEISGAGQVHPTVMHNMGLDPERYTGFAFGSGLERLTMLRYGINDLRLFLEGDLRFLKQFTQ